jgi:ATP phosphoribosyltransferase
VGTTLKCLRLNRIEQVFAKQKALLRKAAAAADQLWQSLDMVLDETQAEECRNYFENAGYASKQ